MDEKLDEKDVLLIEELKKDAKLSEAGLARKTRIPMTTVHNRLRKLRGLGVIKGYTIRLDHERLGRPIVAFVLVKSAGGMDRKELLRYFAILPHVCEASLIAEEYDIICKVRVSSISELDGFVQKMRDQQGIADSRVMISYQTMEVE